jgi:hypothetical protein
VEVDLQKISKFCLRYLKNNNMVVCIILYSSRINDDKCEIDGTRHVKADGLKENPL